MATHRRNIISMSEHEMAGKELLRQAFAYVQRLERKVKCISHYGELFQADLAAIRNKIREKCEQVLYLSCSQRRKAEELLWRHVFYNVTGLCKQYKEILSSSHPLYSAYQAHLMSASAYYQQLIQSLEEHYQISITRMDCSQLEELEGNNADLVWLREACQRSFVYLGDVARYQVDLGFSPEHAVLFYHQAIKLDPGNGIPYNQLAALAETRNDPLDAAYYYFRSISSPHPFPGSDGNLQRLFVKNADRLLSLKDKAGTITEPSISDFKKRMLVSLFIKLQDLFFQSAKTPSQPRLPANTANKRRGGDQREGGGANAAASADVSRLCTELAALLEECLDHDLREFVESCHKLASSILANNQSIMNQSESNHVLLSDSVMLKLCTLTILPAYSLRLHGSVYTLPASAFSLSVLSLLLHHSHRRLVAASLTTAKCRNLNPQTHTVAVTAEDVEKAVKVDSTMISLLSSCNNGLEDRAKDSEEPVSVDQLIPLSGKKGSSDEKNSGDLSSELHKQLNITEDKVVSTTSVSNQVKTPIRSGSKDDPNAKGKLEKKNNNGRVQQPPSFRPGQRRRRRRMAAVMSSEDETEEESDSDSTKSSASSQASQDSLSTDGLTQDTQTLSESPTDSSSGSDTELSDDNSKEHHFPQANPDIATIPDPGSHNLLGSRSQKSSTNITSSLATGVGKKGRNIVLAANFAASSVEGPVPSLQGIQTMDTTQAIRPTKADSSMDGILKQLYHKATQQELLHTACEICAKESYLRCIKVFVDWLQSNPAVVATYGSSATSIWSRLATLLNFLPSKSILSEAGVIPKSTGGDGWTQTEPLPEDVMLRGFSPLLRVQEEINYCLDTPLLSMQGLILICCLQKFAFYIANSKTMQSFEYDGRTGQFVGPAQKEKIAAAKAEAICKEEEEKMQANRSRLMKAMAKQRLQSEVAALTQANAKKQSAVFPPYIIPDASTMCNSLHLVKRLLKAEKFVFVIAKSVIESLDQMKKGRENYSAREAIKFLEKELQGGNRFLRTQGLHETINPDAQKPRKLDMEIWLFNRLIDCAVYFNCYSTAPAETGGGNEASSLVTLLLDKAVTSAVEGTSTNRLGTSSTINHELLQLATSAQQSGVSIDFMLRFYRRWQASKK